MKVIKDKVTKQEISTMPKVLFAGEISVIDSEEEVKSAVEDLKKHNRIGIDSETRPNFRRGVMHKVALLQVSTYDHCYLFRLNKIGMPDDLIRLLESDSIMKIGLSLKDDLRALRKRVGLKPNNWIDLQDIVKQFGIKDLSLQKIYANLFGKKISKNQRLTNWEADELTESQQKYACTDAWSCLEIYDLLKEMERTGDYEDETTFDEPAESEKIQP